MNDENRQNDPLLAVIDDSKTTGIKPATVLLHIFMSLKLLVVNDYS